MKHLQNLHTHSTYCDGKDTPEEMIALAMAKGFDSVGFSGHSCMSFSKNFSMSPEGTEEYKKEIKALKEKYRGKIDVYLGLELEMYSDVPTDGYEYIIGSCHYFKIGDEYVGFDRSAEQVREVIDRYFGGDGMAFAKEYYSIVTRLPEYANIDILGHFDLITKNCEKTFLFDRESKEYLDYAFCAIEHLAGKIPFFEVNTGAISRGYRTSPYPSIPLLREFKRRGFGAMISSDCHDGRQLDCHFEESRELLRECGFKERYILTDDGFRAVEL